MLKHRSICILLATFLIFALLPVQGFAADDYNAVKLTHRGVSSSLTHYIEYTYNGKTYRSDQTGSLLNYAAWEKMSDADKRKVNKWYVGFNSQMEAQFNRVSDMRDYSMSVSGWAQAGEILRKRLAAKNYPELQAFYEDGTGAGAYQLDYSVRSMLTPAELEAYDAAANTYGIAYNMGQSAYLKLIQLKQKQINAAVTAISSTLIDLIMKYSMPPRPGEVLDTLEDTLKDYIKESIGIENKIKDLVGLTKLTGEADRIEADKAAEVIDLFWQLMAVQENMAFKCMQKCVQQQEILEGLGASCASTAQRRASEQEAAEAGRQQAYEAAVNAQAALIDLDPQINVEPEAGESLENYDRRRLAAAKQWAEDEFDACEAGLRQLWNGGYSPAAFTPDENDPSYFNYNRWMEWSNSPKTFYTRAFRTFLNMRRRDANPEMADDLTAEELAAEDRYVLYSSETMLLRDPEELFNYCANYDGWLNAIYAGFDNADAALAAIEGEINAYITARQQIAVNFRTDATPYRNRAYNLTSGFCSFADDGYGDWGVAPLRWESFQNSFENLCETLRMEYEYQDGLNGKNAYTLLEQVRTERRENAQNRAEYEQLQEKFEATLPELYELYAYSQDELDYSLNLATRTIDKIETLQAGYPEWIRNSTAGFSPIAGGQVAAKNGIDNDVLDQTVFAGISSVPERLRIMREELVPMLEDYRSQEAALFADLDNANDLLQEAVAKRTADENALWGRESELQNLNALQLGALTIRNHVDMMQDYGYYDYYYRLTPIPQKTAAIDTLLADLSGTSPYMIKILELHKEVLEKKGDLLRMAQAGTLRTTNYSGSVTYDDHYWKNGNSSRYTSGIYGDAFFRSYTSSLVYNYWYGNIQPILQDLDDVLYNNKQYYPVVALSKGAMQLRNPAVDLTLEMGRSALLTVEVEPYYASYPELIWTSSDETVASVDADGVVTGLLPGSVVITAMAVDSPSDDRITVSYNVLVESEGVTSLADLGYGYYLLAPKVEQNGTSLTITGILGANGDMFFPAKVMFAAYDGDRFLGCAMTDCVCYEGETHDISVTIDLGSVPAAIPTVRMYLVNRNSFVPAEYYTPLVL